MGVRVAGGNVDHTEYLGDGVYADYVRGSVCVYTSDGTVCQNRVFLEREVAEALINYIRRVHRGKIK